MAIPPVDIERLDMANSESGEHAFDNLVPNICSGFRRQVSPEVDIIV